MVSRGKPAARVKSARIWSTITITMLGRLPAGTEVEPVI